MQLRSDVEEFTPLILKGLWVRDEVLRPDPTCKMRLQTTMELQGYWNGKDLRVIMNGRPAKKYVSHLQINFDDYYLSWDYKNCCDPLYKNRATFPMDGSEIVPYTTPGMVAYGECDCVYCSM